MPGPRLGCRPSLLVAASGLKRVTRSERLPSFLDDRCDVAENMRNAQAGHMLGQVAPMRPNVTERRRGSPFSIEPPRVVSVLE